jgi:hypothetical protein
VIKKIERMICSSDCPRYTFFEEKIRIKIRSHVTMSGAQFTKKGLLIPAQWLRKMGDDINVQRAGAVVIVESKQRLAARKRLAKMVRVLRRAAGEIGPLEDKDVSALVDDVRQARAGHR